MKTTKTGVNISIVAAVLLIVAVFTKEPIWLAKTSLIASALFGCFGFFMIVNGAKTWR